MENGNVSGDGRSRTTLIRHAARSGKWLIPLAALAAIALSLLRLNVTPEGWQSERVCAAAEGLGRLVPDPVACIALASLMLIYWGAREREDAAALLGALAGWLTGIPGMATLGQWAMKGAMHMFATIKRKVYEQILADGRSQGHSEGRDIGREEGQSVGRQQANAEWDAWLERQMKAGVFVPDDNDPPPSRARGEE